MGQVYVWAADDEVISLFTLLLTRHKHVVWGTQSLTLLQSRMSVDAPDVCIIDVDRLGSAEDSPVQTLCEWLAREPLLQRIPCLFVMSRSRRSEPVGMYLTAHGHTVLEKPLRREPFMAEIEACLSFQQPQKAYLMTAEDLPTGRLTDSLGLPELKASQVSGTSQNRVDGRRVGSVILEREVGRGGMGIVFRGHQASLRRDVAVKMILPRLLGHAEMIERLRREALAIAKLKSKHVVRVFDAGYTSEGVFFIVMEWLDGIDLEQRLLRQGAMSTSDVLSVIRQIALGLSVAHAEGLVHRDIKPSNIIISESGHATLTDFGLAREDSDPRITDAGTVLGTAHYLAPEQITSGQIDHRTDMYALGIVMFELLTGRAPYDDKMAVEVMRQHLQQPLPDLREEAPFLSEPIWLLLAKMTAKAAEARFHSCEEIIQAIDEINAVSAKQSVLPNKVDDPALQLSGIMPASHNRSTEGISHQSSGSSLMGLSASRGLWSQLSEIDAVGAFRMSLSGSLEQARGSIQPMWKDSLQLLVAVIQQIEASIELGPWEEVLCESRPQSMCVRQRQDAVEADLFTHQQLPSFLRMARSSALGTPMPAGRDSQLPLAALSAAVGVDGLMLMSREGELQQHLLPPSLGLTPDSFAQRMSPLAHLLGALPFALDGLDCSFADGRFLVWQFPEQYLYVLGKHQLNKTLLTILVWRHFEQLRSVGAAALSSASSHRPDTPTPIAFGRRDNIPPAGGVVAPMAQVTQPSPIHDDVLSTESIEAIQRAFARYIGPMARTILSREARKMGLSRHTIPAGRRDAVIQRLAEHLESPKRHAFLKDVARLPV